MFTILLKSATNGYLEMSEKPIYALIVPVFRNRDSLPSVLEVVSSLNKQLNDTLELICVVDGSPDDSLAYLAKSLPQQPYSSKLISLSRNFGSFQAIRTGLIEAKAHQYYAVMAADLQEPPEFVLNAFQSLATEPYDIVLGVREFRHDPFWSGLFAKIFWTCYRQLIQPEMPPGGMDIFACNRAFRDRLVAMAESHTSLVGQVLWLGFRRKQINYTRVSRRAGVSAWTFSRKWRYMMDSIFSFTDLPIWGLFSAGYIGLGLAVLLSLLTICAKLTGFISVPGYTALVIIICFFAGLNSLGLGIIGTYVWRTYENTKARPLSVVAYQEEFNVSAERYETL
jgi:polyisoprenyl-phosphate glycosyltransferase